MLEALIQSKTRVKLLLRFFLNPQSKAYLRGLAKEFDESSNSVRIELNRFENAGLISSEKEGNKKIYSVNTHYPLFKDLQRIAFKYYGIDTIVEHILTKLGSVHKVYLTGNLAKGTDSDIIDLTIIGDKIDRSYLARLVTKAEKLVERKIRTLVFDITDTYKLPEPNILIFGD